MWICIYIICTFKYCFIGPIYGHCSYNINLRTTEKAPLFSGTLRWSGEGAVARNGSVTDRVHGI